MLYKILIAFFLFCFNISSGQSRENRKESNSPTRSAGAESITNHLITRELNIDYRNVLKELNEKILKSELKKAAILLNVDKDTQIISLSIDTSKINISELKNKLHEKGYFLSIPKIKVIEVTVAAPPPPMPIEKYKPEIDKFLNSEDSTIFTNQFKKYDLQKIHPSRRIYYQVIEKVHVCGERIKKIENNLSESNIDDITKKSGASKKDAEDLLLKGAKNDINEVETILDTLLPLGEELEAFSSSQKKYYDGLIDKFNALYVKINPQ